MLCSFYQVMRWSWLCYTDWSGLRSMGGWLCVSVELKWRHMIFYWFQSLFVQYLVRLTTPTASKLCITSAVIVSFGKLICGNTNRSTAPYTHIHIRAQAYLSFIIYIYTGKDYSIYPHSVRCEFHPCLKTEYVGNGQHQGITVIKVLGQPSRSRYTRSEDKMLVVGIDL